MSYAFNKCIEAQTAFDTAEESYIKFLGSFITTIISPFRRSLSKYNLTEIEHSHLNDLFNSIEELSAFHSKSRDVLSFSLSSDHSVITHGHGRNRHLHPTHPVSPPATTLHADILVIYGHMPFIYKKYFDLALSSLSRLSSMISRTKSIKKYITTRCADVSSIQYNNKPYASFAEILRDILNHGYKQSNRLQMIAAFKSLKNGKEAKAFRDNMRTNLENTFMKSWEEIHRGKFDLLHIDLTLTQTNHNHVTIYDDTRRLMVWFSVDITSKSRSTKNLFGLNKKSEAGILYVFNDMILICSKQQHKLKLCYSLYDDLWCMNHGDNDECSIVFKHKTQKKVSVSMNKAEICSAAYDTIQQYQAILKEQQKRNRRSTISEEYTLNDIPKSPPVPIQQTTQSLPCNRSNYGICKSSSYQSQSQSASASRSQLQANTMYNRGSLQSATHSILTENTTFTCDLSEPRTSKAFSIQHTPVTVQCQTPLIQSDNEDDDDDDKDDDDDNDDVNDDDNHTEDSDNDVNVSETQQQQHIEQRRQQFETYRSTSLQHRRRFSVPSMLSSIASSGNTDNDEDSTGREATPPLSIKRSKSFGVRLDAKQVRFQNNNSVNSNNNQDIVINIAERVKIGKIDNVSPLIMIDDIPIYNEEDMIVKEIENVEEEQTLIQGHKDNEKERIEIAQIDLDREETASLDSKQLEDDPHGVLNVVIENYTHADDRTFKMNLLLKPTWADDDEEEFCAREYPQLNREQFVAAHLDVLDNVKYSQNMHIHKQKMAKKLENMDNLNAKMKQQIISSHNNNRVPRHPFERFLDEMHEYEENGGDDIVDNNNLKVNNNEMHPHRRLQSRELYYLDDNDEEIGGTPCGVVDNATAAAVGVYKADMVQQKSGASSTNNNLSIKMGHSSQNVSLSTLGPSPSLLLEDLDDNNNGSNDHDNDNGCVANGIPPTQHLLDRFNLQTNNGLLLAEIQRLRSIISDDREDVVQLNRDVTSLKELMTDNEDQCTQLRLRNDSLQNKYDLCWEQLEESKREIIRLKKDNEHFKNIVHDYTLMDIDNQRDDSSTATSSRPTPTAQSQLVQLPQMSWSKSDINSDREIAPGLLQRRIHNNKNKSNNKKKTKTFRPKYHSFAFGEAKKEHLRRLRDRRTTTTATGTGTTTSKRKKEKENEEPNTNIDHLHSVKNKLHSLNMSQLMPQSMTNMTPQASKQSTPRNERAAHEIIKKISSKSLVSNTSSYINEDDDDDESAPTLSLHGPISAPTTLHDLSFATFGSPIGSPSPQCSPFPQLFASLNIDRNEMVDIRGKSYDNHNHHRRSTATTTTTATSSNYNLRDAMSPRSTSITSHHQRKDTPTPTKSLKKISKFIYSDRDSMKKRISFAKQPHPHPQPMQYVEDDDKSDISINRIQNGRRDLLEKRRITYTKSANTVLREKEPKLSNNDRESPVKSSSGSPYEIPSYFRAHSKSFTTHHIQARQRRSGSQTIHSSSATRKMALKDRTRSGSAQKTKTFETKAKSKYMRQKPIASINHHTGNHYHNPMAKHIFPKRRSVNIVPTPLHSLKPRGKKTKKFLSKSPNFIPHTTPLSYPTTFNQFTLND